MVFLLKQMQQQLTFFGAKSKEYIRGKPPAILSPKFQKDGKLSDELAMETLKKAMSGRGCFL